MNQSSEGNGENKNVVESVYYTVINLFRHVLLNIRRNMGLFLLCLLLPCIFFIARGISKSAVYSASFTVMYDDLTRKIYGDRIEKINSLLQNNRHQMVSRLLGIKPEQAKRLKAIQGKNILGQDLTEDMNTDKIPFVVTIIASDSSGFTVVQDRLVEFLETGTQFLANRQAVKLQEIENELGFINKQLILMDSLGRMVNLSTSFNSETRNNGNGKGANSIYESSYELYKKKQELERRRSFPTSLHVIDDIIVPVKVKASWAGALVKGILTGIALYAVVALFIIPVFRHRDTKNI